MLHLNKSFFCVIPFITISSLAYADVIYTDADFISPSGPIKSGDGIGNVIINTSDTIQPHVVSVAPDYALTAADGSTLTVNNEGQFIIDGWKGIFAQNLKNDGSISQVFLDGPGEIVINEQYGIDAFDKSELISNSKIIINAQFGGLTGAGSTQVVFNNEVDINVATGIGVFLANGDPNNLASIDFMDKATIHTDTGSAVQAIGGYGVDVPTSTITFHNGLEASVEHGNVLESSNDSTVTVNGDSHLWAKDRYGMVALSQDNGTININGKATVLGDFLAQYDGTINLDFKDGSEMTGAIFLNLNYSTGGVVNAKMTGSIWNMNRSSEVTSLDLTITWSSLQIFLMPPPHTQYLNQRHPCG